LYTLIIVLLWLAAVVAWASQEAIPGCKRGYSAEYIKLKAEQAGLPHQYK
jgi:hypothetical protein